MNITIINDCKDDNVKGRQLARVASLFGVSANYVGVDNELEASGNLIDVLDAIGEGQAVILVNVAPRSGAAKKHPNGTPFGYFWYKNTLVVSSIDGLALSMAKKFGLTDYINVLDIPTALDTIIKAGELDSNLKNHITNTQFRSYEFTPRVAAFLFKHKDIESTKLPISEIPNAPAAVWWVDNFGNCKTTAFAEEFSLKAGDSLKTKAGKLTYYSRLKDVPDKAKGIITGSSGLGEKRFLEIVIQGSSASKKLKLYSGENIR